MIEAFVAYSSDAQVPMLAATMEAWAQIEGVEPVAVQVKESRYELDRRLVADAKSQNKWYLLVDLGCGPDGAFTIPPLDGRYGMYGLSPVAITGQQGSGHVPNRLCELHCAYCDSLRSLSVTPTGVRICQRAVIMKWLAPNGGDYNREHAESVRKSGKRVAIVRDVFYKSLLAC